MDYIKKNKKKIIITAIALVVLLLVVVLFKTLMPDMTKSTWGNRLEGIKEHKIPDDTIDKIKSSIKAKEVTYKLTGRTMEFIIKVNSGTSRDEATKLTSSILENIKTEDQNYYDIQVFFTSEDSSSKDFPFIGYKHKTSAEFSYSNVGDE